MIGAWTASLSKETVFDALRRHPVPAAPVLDLVEVMNDHHMHGRGMLHWVDCPEDGRVVLPSSPLRCDGEEHIKPVPSAGLGAHNAEIFGDWLGLPADELASLAADEVIWCLQAEWSTRADAARRRPGPVARVNRVSGWASRCYRVADFAVNSVCAPDPARRRFR